MDCWQNEIAYEENIKKFGKTIADEIENKKMEDFKNFLLKKKKPKKLKLLKKKLNFLKNLLKKE